jgi:hypothetical protein
VKCFCCNSRLGTNDLLEEYPTGKRVAYDPARGLLWAVCDRCGRWNLSPLDDAERRRAIETLEQHFGAASSRGSSNGIGVAGLPGGVSLIRVGDCPWPEFAAWRYGTRFVRRRSWAWASSMLAGGIAGAAVALQVPTAYIGAGLVALVAFNAYVAWVQLDEPVWRRSLTPGGRAALRMMSAKRAFFEVQGNDWRVVLRRRGGEVTLTGREALRALQMLLPLCTGNAPSDRDLGEAIEMVERVGGPDHAFAKWLSVAMPEARGELMKLSKPVALALEMATHEETERRALRGELALLAPEATDARRTAAIVEELA